MDAVSFSSAPQGNWLLLRQSNSKVNPIPGVRPQDLMVKLNVLFTESQYFGDQPYIELSTKVEMPSLYWLPVRYFSNDIVIWMDFKQSNHFSTNGHNGAGTLFLQSCLSYTLKKQMSRGYGVGESMEEVMYLPCSFVGGVGLEGQGNSQGYGRGGMEEVMHLPCPLSLWAWRDRKIQSLKIMIDIIKQVPRS